MKTGSLTDRIARVLFNYRITPQITTGLSPAKLLMSRRLSSRLDLMVPSVSRRVQRSQSQKKMTMIFMPVTVRFLRETECMHALLLPVQKPSGYLGKLCKRQDHFHAKYSCRMELFGGDIRITFVSVSLSKRKRLLHLLRPYFMRPSWESTPNQTESSPEDGVTSEQKLEETPARQTQQTERWYSMKVHRPPERYSDTL